MSPAVRAWMCPKHSWSTGAFKCCDVAISEEIPSALGLPAVDSSPAMRYRFLGDKLTDPKLIGLKCDPVRRADGRCIVSTRMATALVVFQDGTRRVVPRRRLRVLRESDAIHLQRVRGPKNSP